MYVLYVAPLRPGMPQDKLTYWSKAEIRSGSFVHVRIGRTLVEGLVLGCEDLRSKKQEVRNSSFGIKHIESEMALAQLPEDVTMSLYELSLLSGQTVGDFVVGFLGLDAHRLSTLFRYDRSNSDMYIESDVVTRLKKYIEKFSETSTNTIIVVPSAGHADTLERISSSLGTIPLVFHSNQTKRQREQNEIKLASGNPHICITTPQSCGALLDSTGEVIVEYAHSHLYQIDFISNFNSARALYAFLRLMNISVTVADSHRLPGKVFSQSKEVGSCTPPSLYIADMKDGIQVKNTYFSMAILDFVRNKKSGEKLVLFINRKGVAPQLVCNDCSSTVLCAYCNHPLSLISGEAGIRQTLCASCKKEQALLEGRELTCNTCGSFKITQIGLATESAQSELAKLGFASNIFDSSHIRTYTQAKKAIKGFYIGDVDILVATEMVIPYLLPGYQRICILSIDPLLHHKNYRADFEVRDTVYRLAYLSTHRELLLQTRYTAHMNQILLTDEATYLDTSHKELSMCGYPPETYEVTLKTKKDINQFSHLIENKHISSFVSKLGSVYTIKLRLRTLEETLALVQEYIEVRKEVSLSIN